MTANLQNDDLIARYLLGDLPEEQQVEIEARAFSDQEYRRQIIAVENDLIDEYVRGELSNDRRRRFEKRFLASENRRRRVEFARALATVVSEAGPTLKPAETEAAEQIPWRDSLKAFFSQLAPAARLSLATAALLIVAAVAWSISYSVRQRAALQRLNAQQQSQQTNGRELQQQIDAERRRNVELAARLQQEKEARQKSDEVIDQVQRDVQKPAQPRQNTVFSFVLLPGTSRAAGTLPKLVLPKQARLVRLQVGLEAEEQYQAVRVEIRRQSGQHVWSRDDLPMRTTRSAKTVRLSIPASVFSAGQYELSVKGLTNTRTLEDVGYYYFEVSKD